MGSFDYTCCISGLPISAGASVRYMILSEQPDNEGWGLRTFPLKGRYNDYGSVENIPDGLEKDIWLEGLKIDLIEDEEPTPGFHRITKGFSFEDFQSAIWDERIGVMYDPHELDLRVTPVLLGNPVEENLDWGPDCRRLRLAQAIVREDVWQILLRRPIPSWAIIGDIENLHQRLLEHCKKIQALRKSLGGDWWILHSQGSRLGSYIGGLSTVFGLLDNFHLMLSKTPSDEVLSQFVTTIVETFTVRMALKHMGRQWHPVSKANLGPQFGDWNFHASYLRALAYLAEKRSEILDGVLEGV